MSQREERAWLAGEKAAWASIASTAAGKLGGARGKKLSVLAERARTMRALRDLAKQLGIEPDWPDNAYLPDVVEKFIGRRLPR